MVRIHKLSNYNIKEEDKFLFDANVWIYIYYSIDESRTYAAEKYSDFYGKILEAGNPIYTNSLVISEIINRLERLEFDRVKKVDRLERYKRDFRNNPKYSDTLGYIRLLVENKILSNSNSMNDCFESFNYNTFITSEKTMDFNDAIHCHTALKEDLKIVTNDRDFKNIKHDIDIITFR